MLTYSAGYITTPFSNKHEIIEANKKENEIIFSHKLRRNLFHLGSPKTKIKPGRCCLDKLLHN